jgi:hypothetical protein
MTRIQSHIFYRAVKGTFLLPQRGDEEEESNLKESLHGLLGVTKNEGIWKMGWGGENPHAHIKHTNQQCFKFYF